MEYRFDQIAYNSTEKKQPEDSDRAHYIGLEHLDSGCFGITRWGSDVTPTGEKLVMHKGDILFGKRRAYQRKVGIAPFDGIFSAHGMVLRPKENIIDKDYFPFFIASDQFMERAVRISVGGLSPTINWKDLKEQVFDIPTIDEQRKLAAKLWAAYRLKESYKKLLAATDEMVKSRFIEMFGTPENNHNCFPITNLGEICEIVGRIGFRGYTREDLVDNECDGAISLSPSNIIDGELDYTNSTYISWAKYNESPEIMINEGDIVLVKTASVGKCALVKVLPHEATINPQFVVLKKLKINPFYLNTCLQGDYGQRCIKSYTSGSTIPTFTQKQLATMSVVVPPSEKQKEFEVIVRQSDKSKFELKQAIEKIDKVMRALMQ